MVGKYYLFCNVVTILSHLGLTVQYDYDIGMCVLKIQNPAVSGLLSGN